MKCTLGIAAVFDLYWEVKVNALQFWDHFITAHFTNQGMLDGTFPPVTFATDTKRIIQLTEPVIKQRINNALDQLAFQRCFGVSFFQNFFKSPEFILNSFHITDLGIIRNLENIIDSSIKFRK